MVLVTGRPLLVIFHPRTLAMFVHRKSEAPITSLLALLLLIRGVGGSVELITPRSHVALTGDVEASVAVSSSEETVVSWEVTSNGSNWAVRLAAADGDMATLAVAPVDEGKAVFRCGAVYLAGRFCFQLIDLAKVPSYAAAWEAESWAVVTQSPVLMVHWPRVKIEVPETMETYTADITARLHVMGVVCYPRRSPIRTWLELAYFGNSMARGALDATYLQELPDFYRIISQDVSLACRLLDRPGFYQVQLRSSVGHPPVVGVSNAMRVTWSERYWLRVAPPTVFPCASVVTVLVRHPPCVGNEDRVRLFGRRSPNVSALATDDILEYVGEERVPPGDGKVQFSCTMFHPSLYHAFCFTYVSAARSGAVTDLRMDCLPAYGDDHGIPRVGNWSPWSSWSDCSVTCGRGTRNRHRFCDSPPPGSGKAFCQGSAIRTDSCRRASCPVLPITVSPVDLVAVSELCRCGCKMNISGSAVVASSARHCNRLSVWLLQVRQDHRMELTMSYIHLRVNESLTIRDGRFQSSPLLLLAKGGEDVKDAPVHSSQNVVLLQFQPTTSRPSRAVANGFVLLVHEITEPAAVIVDSSWIPSRFAGSPAQWTAVALAILALSSAVCLVALHTFRRRRKAKKPVIDSDDEDDDGDNYSVPDDDACDKVAIPPITTSTSVSDISLFHLRRHLRRKKRRVKKQRPKPQPLLLSPVSSDGREMDFDQSESYQREKALSSPPPLSSSPRPIVALMPHPPHRRPPVATVSPQPHRPQLAENKAAMEEEKEKKKGDWKRRSLEAQTAKAVPVARRNNDVPRPRATNGRESLMSTGIESNVSSSPAIPPSASEVSLSGTDIAPDLEYDYYDYDVHDEPGSFFGADSSLLSWLPPFVPQPPDWSDVPLADFSAALGISPISPTRTTSVDAEPGLERRRKRTVTRPVETEEAVDDGIAFADDSDGETKPETGGAKG